LHILGQNFFIFSTSVAHISLVNDLPHAKLWSLQSPIKQIKYRIVKAICFTIIAVKTTALNLHYVAFHSSWKNSVHTSTTSTILGGVLEKIIQHIRFMNSAYFHSDGYCVYIILEVHRHLKKSSSDSEVVLHGTHTADLSCHTPYIQWKGHLQTNLIYFTSYLLQRLL